MTKRKDKRALILDAMEKIICDGNAEHCSVDEIARVAGICKGSIYYYYESKREIEMDLYFKTYGGFIEKCESIPKTEANTMEKLKTLFRTYYSQTLHLTMDDYLHLPQNMDMHTKVLALLVKSISPILSKILEEGVEEGIFKCKNTDEYSNFYVGIFVFMFDPGIFDLTAEDSFNRLATFAELMERGLKAKKGCLSFVHDKDFLLSLRSESESELNMTKADISLMRNTPSSSKKRFPI